MTTWWSWREGDDDVVPLHPSVWAYDEETDTWIDLATDPEVIWWW